MSSPLFPGGHEPPRHIPLTRGGSAARDAYDMALAALLQAGEGNVAAEDALTDAAVTFAASRAGADRITRDIYAAETANAWSRAALLRSALKRGEERAFAIASDPTPTSPTPTLGHRALKDWQPDQPIWPKRDHVEATLLAAGIPVADRLLAAKAYRSLFARAWRACFYPDDATTPVPPYTDEEGWRWRRGATEIADRDFAGAVAVPVADLTPGMIVYNGFGARTVRSMQVTGSAPMSRDGSEVVSVNICQIAYTDGQIDRGVAADAHLIRLVALEQRSGNSPKAPLPKLDFS